MNHYKCIYASLLTILIVLIALIALTSYPYRLIQYESFIPSLSLLVDEKPETLSIKYNLSLYNDWITSLPKVSKNIYITEDTNNSNVNNDNNNKKTLYVEDAFTFSRRSKLSNTRCLTSIPKQVVLYIVKPIEIPTREFTDNDFTIGYFDDTQLDILKLLTNGMDDEKVQRIKFQRLKKTNKLKAITKSLFVENKIDSVACYNSLESPLINVISPELKIDIVDYGEFLNMDKLKVMVPFVKKQNIDFSLHFPQLKGKRAVLKSVVAFDILIVGHSDITQSNITNDLQSILSYIDHHEMINFYQQYFEMFDISVRYAKSKDKLILERGNKQILEQYQNDDFVLNLKSNVNGFYDSVQGTLVIYSETLDGFPIHVGTKLQLSGQVRDEENGLYAVERLLKKQPILRKLYKETKDTIIESNEYEAGYRCYDHPEIVSKGLCESMFDVQGFPKPKKTFWDKVCVQNSDCPFYQGNKNYKNYRGGCIDGRCEIPLGVKQESFRKFDSTSVAMCHQCLDRLNPYCCEEQKNRVKYPNLLSPDYAFKLDEFERKAA
jgi:hypothetical protein